MKPKANPTLIGTARRMCPAVTGLTAIARMAEIVVGAADVPAEVDAIVGAADAAADGPVAADGIVGAAGRAGEETRAISHRFARIKEEIREATTRVVAFFSSANLGALGPAVCPRTCLRDLPCPFVPSDRLWR